MTKRQSQLMPCLWPLLGGVEDLDYYDVIGKGRINNNIIASNHQFPSARHSPWAVHLRVFSEPGNLFFDLVF